MRLRSACTLVAWLNAIGLSTTVARGQPAAAATPVSFSDRLSGDWGGARSRLVDRGVSLDLDVSQYYQDLLSGTPGGDPDKDAGYGARFDALVNFDVGKLGLWKGGVFKTHTEYQDASLTPTLGGVLLPTNLGIRLPEDPHTWVATSLYLAQRLGDRANLMIGKVNTVDLLLGEPFLGGQGYLRAWNLAFAAPPNGLLPPVIMGTIVSLKTAPLTWTFMAYDPEDRTRDYLPDDLFATGVNVSLGAKRATRIARRTTSVAVAAIYSTKDDVDLGDVLLPPDLRTGVKNDCYHASIQLSHFLRESAETPGSGWGIFAKLGLSDGNPNPYQAWITSGLGGKGLIASRPDDSFGLGYFYYGFSDELQGAISPLVQFDDEQGVEVFYDMTLVRWLHVAADLQFVNPGIGGNDNVVAAGIRARMQL